MSRIFQYEIQGSRYSKAKTGLEKGIFERNTSYFLVIHKKVKNEKSLGIESNNAIFLWKGTDTYSVNKNAVEKYIVTPFKSIKTQSGAGPQAMNKRISTFVGTTSSLLKRSSTNFETINTGGVGKMQKEQIVTDIKEVLTPIYTGKSKFDPEDALADNVQSKVSGDTCLVSTRSIITQDNEPNFFTVMFSGSMVVRSFEFYEYGQDDEYGNVMLFQLIGVPHLNQKAVEVPVKWDSLSLTGLYVLLADEHVYFWIGSIYYNKYLNPKTYNREGYLLSEDMLKKLNYIYDEESIGVVGNEKTLHFILEDLETDEFRRIMTKDSTVEIDIPSYESDIITQNSLIPQIPRCFCIYERGITPDYEEVLNNNLRHETENENFLFKEFSNFDQLTFMQKGVYLLTMHSDSFIWIGSKVESWDIPKVLIEVPEKVSKQSNLHIIYENYEPQVFTAMFENWKSRMASMLIGTHSSPNLLIPFNLDKMHNKNSSSLAKSEAVPITEITEEAEGEDSDGNYPQSNNTSSDFNDEEDEMFMKELEIETKGLTRILPMDLWKKIVYS